MPTFYGVPAMSYRSSPCMLLFTRTGAATDCRVYNRTLAIHPDGGVSCFSRRDELAGCLPKERPLVIYPAPNVSLPYAGWSSWIRALTFSGASRPYIDELA